MEIGQLDIKKMQGFASAYQEGIISFDNVVMYSKTLFESTLNLHSPIYFQYKIIGEIKNINYSSALGQLILYFNLNPGKESTLIEKQQEHYSIQPDIDFAQIECPECGEQYQIGNSPCDCIFKSDLLIPLKIKIKSMTIFDILDYNIVGINHKIVLRKFFGGTMANLIISDPI